MATSHILVVDSDDGFGNMLTEALRNSGLYTARRVQTGGDALQAVVEEVFDLVIIDMAVNDMAPATLVHAVREAKSGMRIMMIPFIGQDLPGSIKSLDINGILTKPFFVGALPDLINQAIGQGKSRSTAPGAVTPPAPPKISPPPPLPRTSPAPPLPVQSQPAQQSRPMAAVAAPVSPPVPVEVPQAMLPQIPQETIRFLRANETEILRLLDDLNREVRAEAILLIAGSELIAQAGLLSRVQCQELTLLVSQSSQAVAQAARFLGERAGRFAQSLHEGAEYRLYSLSLGEGILLSLALSSNVPLGMIRHQCRQIADRLAKFII